MVSPRTRITQRRRRSFGRMIEKNGKRGDRTYRYIECSYPTPLWAFEKWPNLPRRQYKTFPLEREMDAAAWLNKEQKLIDNETWTPPRIREARERRDTVSFAEYATAYVENHHKRNGDPIADTTRDKYREYLRLYLIPAFGDKAMITITHDDIQRWYDAFPVRKGGYGGSARRHVYELLSAIFAEAATKPLNQEGDTLIKVNPCSIAVYRPQRRKEPVVAEPEELTALYDAMPAWLRLSVYLCGVLGLREGECLALQRSDVELDADKPVVHVRRSAKEIMKGGHRVIVLGNTKTASSVRDVDVPRFLIEVIRLHLEIFVTEEPDALLFTSPKNGGPVKQQTVRNAWYRALKQVPRLEGMRFYDLRHTALSKAVEAGASLGTVKNMAGHTIDTTAFNYQHESKANRDLTLKHIDEAFTSDSTSADAYDSPQAESILSLFKTLSADKQKQVMDSLPPDVLAQVITTTLRGE